MPPDEVLDGVFDPEPAPAPSNEDTGAPDSPDAEQEGGVEPDDTGASPTEADDEAEGQPEPDETEDKDQSDGGRKREGGVSKRIREKTEQAREALERAAKAEARAAALEKQISEMNDLGSMPQLADYDYDQERYQEAMLNFNAKLTQKSVSAAMMQAERLAAKEATTEAQRATLDQFQEAVKEYSSTRPDFMEVVGRYQPTQAMTQGIMLADNGPQVAFYLGKNLHVVEEIRSLPPAKQMLRIGALAERLSRPVQKRTTRAPEPPKPVRGSSGTPTRDLNKLSGDDYRRARGYLPKR